MKKILAIALGSLLILSACSKVPDSTKTDSTAGTAEATVGVFAYNDPTTGISFQYPTKLSSQKDGQKVLLTHGVPFQHQDPCDFKGDGTQLAKLTDFNVSLEVMEKSLKDTVKATQAPSFMQSYFLGKNLKLSEGFIDADTQGALTGYRIMQGVEGCGFFKYYYPLGTAATLVVTRAYVTELSSSIDAGTRAKAEGLANVMLPAEEQKVFGEVMKSFVYTKASV